METKKVPLSALQLRAKKVASNLDISPKDALNALTEAHEKLGIKVDSGTSDATDLNFVGRTFDPDKTQPMPAMQALKETPSQQTV